MQLPDVNILIYSHRAESPEHERYAEWLTNTGGARQRISSLTAELATMQERNAGLY